VVVVDRGIEDVDSVRLPSLASTAGCGRVARWATVGSADAPRRKRSTTGPASWQIIVFLLRIHEVYELVQGAEKALDGQAHRQVGGSFPVFCLLDDLGQGVEVVLQQEA